MNLAAIPTLPEMVDDPARTIALPSEVARKILTMFAACTPSLMVAAMKTENGDGAQPDHLIPLSEAGKLLDRSRYWFYEHRHELPFIVGTGRSMKCSYNGVMEFIRDRKG